MIAVTIAEMADVALGVVLLTLGVYVLKDEIARGWMILAYVLLQGAWSAFMVMFNFWTLDGWVLLVNVLWTAILIISVRLIQIGWPAQQRRIERREEDRLRRILSRHERID